MTRFESLLSRPPDRYDKLGRAWYASGSAYVDGEPHETSAAHMLEVPGTDPAYLRRVRAKLKRRLSDEVRGFNGGQAPVVLDMGGGTGQFFDAVADAVDTYINVDPLCRVPADGEEQRLQDSHYRRLVCSATEIPLVDGCVDVVLSLASLDHIRDHRAALAEAARVTRPGGRLLVLLNNRGSWWKAVLAGTEIMRRRDEIISRDHHIQITISELIMMLSEFFRPQRWYTLTFLPHIPVAWHVLLPIFDAVGPLLLPIRGANSIVVCERP